MRALTLLLALCSCAAPHDMHTAADADGVDVAVPADSATADASPDVAPQLGSVLVAILGQSNAIGFGRADQLTGSDAELATAFPGVLYDAVVIVAAGVPLGPNFARYSFGPLAPYSYEGGAAQFGAEMTMGRDLAAAAPGKFFITKWAQSGASLSLNLGAGVAYPGVGPNEAHLMLMHVGNAMEACDCSQLVVVWIQGEADAQTVADAQEYQQKLTGLIALFRSSWPSSRWVVSRLNDDFVNSIYHPQATATVQAAEAAVVAGDSLTALVDPSAIALSSDHTHYTTQGYLQLGHLYASAVLAVNP
jgi:hypothetical protein